MNIYTIIYLKPDTKDADAWHEGNDSTHKFNAYAANFFALIFTGTPVQA